MFLRVRISFQAQHKIIYNYKLKFATVINVVKSYFHRSEILLATTYKLVLHDRDESFKGVKVTLRYKVSNCHWDV